MTRSTQTGQSSDDTLDRLYRLRDHAVLAIAAIEEPTDENSIRRSLAICDYSDRLPAYSLDIRICSYLAVTNPSDSDLWQVFDAPAISRLARHSGDKQTSSERVTVAAFDPQRTHIDFARL